MQLGTQYYRPPFPNQAYWEADIKAVAAAGLNTLQLWVLWSWVEAKPGEFRFDDYDRLVALADRHGLKVVLSVIGEVQPLWIHRLIPGSEMINDLGHRVVSTNRRECHFGLSPGACTDHPEVWRRMGGFFRAVVERYRAAPSLFGWDAWNELRWNVHAQGLVCYCPYTLKAFRDGLKQRYGDLDGLNAAWLRRYVAWDDVMPGRGPNRPFTEMMAFQHFLTERANAHARARYDLIKSLDPDHPVTVHGAQPSAYASGGPGSGHQETTTPVDRGNDWEFADHLDGVGCSSFPKWGHWDWKDYAARMEIIRSSAGTKRLWLSELQGGRAQSGPHVHLPVPALDQQHWIYNGLAAGAEAILFWCWRDEVFTTESGGFGIIGQDGYAEERVAALRQTGAVIREHGDLFAAYRPSTPEVGVLFSPQSYYLRWCHDTHATQSRMAFLGYCRALVERNIPFEAVEERHLERLAGLKVLFLPRVQVLDAETEDALLRFVHEGGTLLAEAESGAYDSRGLYRYPGDRFIARATGACEVGLRANEAPERLVRAMVGDRVYALKAAPQLCPWRAPDAVAWASQAEGAVVAEQRYGKGRFILVGSYLGEDYQSGGSPDFSAFLDAIVSSSGVEAKIVGSGPVALHMHVFTRHGLANGKRVIFVLGHTDQETVGLRLAPSIAGTGVFRDLISGQTLRFQSTGASFEGTVALTRWRMALLAEE